MPYLPLDGVRVLDLARLIPGDHATRKLADLGADVVKVEPPGAGDYLRTIPPLYEGEGLNHWALNRGKRSIVLDLRDETERGTFFRLAAVADVIVEVSQPGMFEALGVDFADLRRQRPELVVCSITGFGQTGPLAPLLSHGMSMDALAGCAVIERRDGRSYFSASGPMTSLAVEAGAGAAANAILAALFAAKQRGEGAWIDISCWDAAAETNRTAIAYRLAMGHPRPHAMDDWSLYAIYDTEDGAQVLLCAIEQKFWERFCRGVDREDLIAHWQSEGSVDYGATWLRDELEPIFRAATAAEWLDRFLAWGVPGGPVVERGQLTDLPHLWERGLVQPEWSGSMPNVLSPIRWMEDGSRPGDRSGPCSPLGADTAEVLASWLGERPEG